MNSLTKQFEATLKFAPARASLSSFSNNYQVAKQELTGEQYVKYLDTYQVSQLVYDPTNIDHVAYINECKAYGVVKAFKLPPISFYHKDWIELHKLFVQISNLRKGEQHKTCKQVVSFLDKHWDTTVSKNSNKDVLHFIRLCKKLNIKCNFEFTRDKFKPGNRAQMYAINAFMRMPETLHRIQDTTTNMCVSFDGLSVALDGMNNNFLQFNAIVQHLLAKVQGVMNISELTMIMLKMVAFTYLVCTIEHNIPNITAMLTLILPVNVIGNLSELFLTGLMRAVQSIRAQFSTNVAQIDNNASIITSFFDLTKMIFIGFMKPIDIEAFKGMTISCNKIKIVSEYLKSAHTIMEYGICMFQHLVTFISDKIVKYYGVLPSFMKSDELTDIIDLYQQYNDANIYEKALINSSDARKVLELYNKSQKYESEIYKSLNNKSASIMKLKVLPYLRLINITLQKVINDIPPHVRNGFEGFRKKPYWLYIFGESSIGKSSLIQPIIANALASKLKLIDTFDDPHNYSYFRVCGAKFYAKYNKQPIFQYNDLFQNYSNDEAMNEAVIELTNIVDEAPFELNMPDVESKGKVFCVSDIVLSNAQDDIIGQSFLKDRCWSNGIHLYRRRNLVIEPLINVKYRNKLPTPGVNWHLVNASLGSPSRYVNFIPDDLYRIRFTDPVSGVVQQILDLDAAIDYIVEDAYNYFHRQDDFHEKLISCMKHTFNVAQIDDEFFDARCDCVNVMYNKMSCHPLVQNDNWFATVVKTYIMSMHELHPTLVCLRARRLQHPESEHNNMEFILNDIMLAAMYDYSMRVRAPLPNRILSCMRGFFQSAKDKILQFGNLSMFIGVSALFGVIGTLYAFLPKITNVAHSEEGNKRAHKVRIRRKMRPEPQTTGEAQYDNSNKVVEDVLRNNFCTFYIRLYKDDVLTDVKTYMNSLCVGGSIFVLPRHYWKVLKGVNDLAKQQNARIELYLRWFGGNETVIPWSNIDLFEPEADYLIDIVFIHVKRLTARRDIRHFWVQETDDLEFNESYLYGLRSRSTNNGDVSVISVDGTRLAGCEYKLEPPNIPGLGNVGVEIIKTPAVYEYYNAKTVGGDCGSVLMFVNPKLNGRVIAGMHVGGNMYLNTGFSAPIFREDLDEAFDYFKSRSTVIVHQQVMNYNVAEMDVSSPMYEPLTNIGVQVFGSTTYYNDRRIKCVIPRKSKIVPSIVSDYMTADFGISTMAPARLRPFKAPDGSEISPFVLAYKKTQKYPPRQIPLKIYDIISEHMHNSIMSWITKFTSGNEKIRKLTWSEAINGIYGMKQLDLSTSPGFPYVFIKGGVGKRPWFNIDKMVDGFIYYKMDDFLMDICKKRIACAQQGIIYETYYIDTLKDETRPIEKVALGKTRLFQIGPMDLTICVRKYFGCFIAHLHTSYLKGECAIGLNCNSPEFNDLVRRFLYKYFGCTDCESFDYSVFFQIGMNFADQANKFYRDQHNRIRETLVATCLGGYHIVDVLVMFFDGGNNSGNAVTSDINDNTNMFINRLVYAIMIDDYLRDYNKNVNGTYYGDDNWLNISDEIIDRFNMVSIAETLARYGFKYTTYSKEDKLVQYYTLEESSFLKRRPLFREDLNIYVGVLPKEVIIEIPRWSESNPNNMRDQLNRFNSALMEAANYSEEYYNELKEKYQLYIRLLKESYHDIDANDLLSYAYIVRNAYGERCPFLKYLT